jgi:thiamine-phosphate pyrophosphorylase
VSPLKLPAFYPVLDSGLLSSRGLSSTDAAEAILEAGARILQFRHKGFFSHDAFESALRIAELCRQANALFVINDRADIAILLDAALHLGQDDLPPADARRIMSPSALIGLSTHNEAQLRSAEREPVNYLAIGPIFPTGSKQNPDPVVGVERLRAWRAISSRPLVAIGGIVRETAPGVLQAGADSVAIIGDLYPDPLTKTALRSRAEEWLAICSSPKTAC